MSQNLPQRLGLESHNSGVCGVDWITSPGGERVESVNPANDTAMASVQAGSAADYEQVVTAAIEKFTEWRMRPAPARGEVVRQIGEALREKKRELGMLVTLEVGKIKSEGEGEVQEMIDMCDFAVGLSRQLYGLTIASERPRHRMFEQWHPLGPVGIITAFNFPVAVWAWNAMLAGVCGNTMIWKPSPQTPLTAVAVQHIVNEVADKHDCRGVFNLCLGDVELGERMVNDPRIPLISATGSCRMGRRVAELAGKRLARTLLELGGNNAMIVSQHADQDLALRAVLFAAVGTAGQRCTSLRRLILHDSIHDAFVDKLSTAYESIPIGEPWNDGVLMGPLVNAQAVDMFERAIATIGEQGGEVVRGGKRIDRAGNYVEPTIVKATPDMAIVHEETFAPILYCLKYSQLEEAVAMHNAVPQGLSSAIFSQDLGETERFLSAAGSDCGIANVNIGTSGAEIGGAFGGEKQTGGGRESGSDAWRAYMRRQTCTVNWGGELPLAQGVKFDV
ncbi:MAG: aldehyde dehydrogenase family protein [Pirellulales bacterium]|nr:aldehyde dehydrogenase family protein [Pirellulales bacterium]